MSATTNVYPEHESRRLGELWRSQGEQFLEEHAETLRADIDRLRDAYVARVTVEKTPARTADRPARGAPVIDLRNADVSGLACSRDGHGHVEAIGRCIRCRNAFCATDLVPPGATRGGPLCTECALVVAGVHHTRSRPLTAPGRPGRGVRP